jgi:hypothetical protein
MAVAPPVAGFAFAPFPFRTLEILSGFLRGNGTGAICAPEIEPVSKSNSCIPSDVLLTLNILLSNRICGSS